ncbi:MAG: hypothetical protein J0M29_22175 [Chitinophagales bacterium]|nr:hypothetical protein [Chitinophagales bacterium]
MTQNTCFQLKLVCLFILWNVMIGAAQQCSHDALTAKYWQYRENFNKHFIMNDRKPEGCIGNGITRAESDFSQLDCGSDLLHGYGLPATSIWMDLDGGRTGMGSDRIDDDPDNPFYNPNCSNAGPSPGYTFNHTGPRKYNFLEYGSETPHQIGWYLVTLATEYELLGKNGQFEEQQRTLEDIFLALQAYRRLDIAANCLVKARYDEITDGFEVENCDIWVANHHYTEDACLCAEKYHNQQCPGDGKWHFDIPCKTNCPWPPDVTGYSGFYIREDAVQEQESLHDPSEDKWNIDLVGGVFAMSQIPPCDDNFSPTCYNEKKVNFLSQDQTFSIMTGLAMVKRYVPPTASVTTCDGAVYHPFDIVQQISNGIVKLPQNASRHVFWPGSPDDDCCWKPVKFGECAGGNLFGTYAGLEYMHNYINEIEDNEHHVGSIDRWSWGKSIGRRAFFAQAMSVGFDIGSYGSDIAKQRIINACVDDKMEILVLMNDLLHPAEPNIMDDEANADLKALFEEMLCSAPCDGPCFKPEGYDNQTDDWPEFNCANTPHWIGQRWEGAGYPPKKWSALYAARQFNGLDYMALYNTYMLCFPQEQTPYYNPERPEPTTTGHLLGEAKIEGPTTLCPGASGSYLLKKTNPAPATLQEIAWESSSNISLSSTSTNPTIATVNTSKTPSYIGVSFKEQIQKQQFYNGIGQDEGYFENLPIPIWIPGPPITIADNCDFSYRKPIITEIPNFFIDLDVDACLLQYHAEAIRAIGAPEIPLPESAFTWAAVNNTNGWNLTGTGRQFDFGDVIPPPHHPCSTVTLTLHINSDCGNIVKSAVVDCNPCPNMGRQILITPNPANNQISVRITQDQTQDFVSTDPNGVRIRIYPSGGGTYTLMDSFLYSNGQVFNTSNIPNGLYTVMATASDLPTIQTNLAIVR